MTKREIIDTAMKGLGMKADGEGSETLMPYLVADVMYQIYRSDIASLRLSGRLRQMGKLWEKRYFLFNKPIFSAFRDEDYSELTDLMDSVNEMLSNEIVMLRSQVMLTLSGIEDFDKRKVVSSLLLCHMFAQYAESSYELAFYHKVECPYFSKIESSKSGDLCYLRDWSYKMAIQYIKEIPGGDLDLNAVDMTSTFRLIAKKIYDWLKVN